MGIFLQDLRYGARLLARSPGFTAVAALVLALGIGANTAIFSVVNAVLLRPLPFADPARLVGIFNRFPDLDRGPASFADLADWRRQNRGFAEMAAVRTLNLNYLGRHEPERIQGAMVSEGFFPMLGLAPVAGRGFLAADHREGAAAVVLVSEELARRELGSVAGVTGRAISLDGQPRLVVGVMPSRLPKALDWADTEVWLPLEPNAPWKQRGTNYLEVIARLRPRISLQQARTEMIVIQKQIDSRFPGNKHDVVVLPLGEALVGQVRPMLLLLLGAVGFVLLIACANVASLVLIRATGRAKELAIRAGLGARRRRVIRQLLTESILLAALGGSCGVLLAMWGTRLLLASWPVNVPRPVSPGSAAVAADWRVLAFTLGVSLAAGILFGLAPALHSSRVDFNEALKEGGRGAAGTPARGGLRRLFVVSEIALATLLLVGAGLMLRSLARLEGVDPGFNPARLLTMAVNLPATKYGTDAKRAAFWSEALARITALPGVKSAATVSDLPLAGSGTTGDFELAGRPPFTAGEQPSAAKEIVSPDYFAAMQVPLLAGRGFTERDRAGAPRVAIINREMARRFWPGEDPVGKKIHPGYYQTDWHEIVGVVGDVRLAGLGAPPGLEIYLCSLQVPQRAMTVLARTASDPLGLTPAIRRQVFAVDPKQPVYRLQLMDQVVGDSLSGRRVASWLLGIFAALAMLLAALGIYGTTAYAATQRTHELGIRVALGARHGEVLKLVAAEGVKAALAGLSLGLLGALALTRLMTGLLYGIQPTDLATFAGVLAGFSAVAVAASCLPARRAMRVDPVAALRWE
jgi:putative ABC transport system permease protein